MKLKIYIKTITKNPNAFSQQLTVATNKQITVKILGDIPFFLNESNFIIKDLQVTETNENIWIGILNDETLIESLSKETNSHIHTEYFYTTVNHLPEPEYLVEYDNIDVECPNCGGTFKSNDIETVYDEYTVNHICPLCKNHEFELTYQTLSELTDKIKSL